MRIFRIANKVITVYHGTRMPFNKFDAYKTAQGIFWFTDDIEEIKNETSGANSSKYILEAEINVEKTAGWDDYDKKFLDQIRQEGFDSINLGSNWIVFDPNRIKMKKWYKRMDDKSYALIS